MLNAHRQHAALFLPPHNLNLRLDMTGKLTHAYFLHCGRTGAIQVMHMGPLRSFSDVTPLCGEVLRHGC